jgi:hypothetical protein
MSQLHFYVPDEIEERLRAQAEQAKLPLSRYLAEIARRETDRHDAWPSNYFDDVFGTWEGDPIERADQGEYEQRSGMA